MRTTRWFTPWVFVAPAFGWLAVFVLWPSVNTVRLSFTDAKPLSTSISFVGAENYVRLLHDDQVRTALINSVVYMAVCLPLLVLLPLLLAVLVEKRLPAVGFFRTAFYTPVIASAVVVGLIWTWLLDDRGAINQIAEALGVISEPIPFLTHRWLLLISAISLTVWKGLGYYMVVYLAALANVPKELHEAAAVDGAGPVRRFWHVTVPGVRGAMILIAILISVAALRVFSELYILTGGTGGAGGLDMSLVMLIQQYARGFSGNLGYASALSVLLFVVTLAPMLILARLNARGRS